MAHHPVTIDALLDLAKAVTGPDARKHIEEIKQHSALAEQARADRSAANRTLTEARDEIARHKVAADSREAALDARAKDLDGKDADLSRREAALKIKEADVAQREARLSSESRTLSTRSAELAQRAGAVEAAERAWGEKVRRIQEAASA